MVISGGEFYLKFGLSFTYNGFSTIDKNLILCADSGADSISLLPDREMVMGNTNYLRNETFGISSKYSDVLSLEIMLIKDPQIYDCQHVQAFTRSELREITSWLTSPNIPMLLEFEDCEENDDGVPVDFFGNFTNVTSFTAGNLYGIKATFQCNAPWGYTKEQIYSSTISGSGNLTINNTSDDWESSVYPYIILSDTQNETVVIENKTDNGKFSLKTERNIDVYIDCRRLMVQKPIENGYDLVRFSDLGWTTDTLDTLYWPRLIHGRNELSITGNCRVVIKCRYPRKVGEL